MNNSQEPILAVIIPTYNRVAQLERCLCSLSRQSLPKDIWEVIVVNDGGAEVSDLVQSFGEKFKVFTQQNQGPAAARNFGVAMTKAAIILFMDDDCEADPQWMKEAYGRIRPGIVVGGKVINQVKNSIFSESNQVLIDFLYEYFANSPLQFFTSNNFGICRHDFLRFGGFRPDFKTSAGEDREFCVRVKQHGMSLQFHPTMLVNHFHPQDLRKFVALHVKYGRAAQIFHRIIHLEQWAIKSSPQFQFYWNLLAFPFSLTHYSRSAKVLISLNLCLSQVCVVLGYLQEKFTR